MKTFSIYVEEKNIPTSQIGDLVRKLSSKHGTQDYDIEMTYPGVFKIRISGYEYTVRGDGTVLSGGPPARQAAPGYSLTTDPMTGYSGPKMDT